MARFWLAFLVLLVANAAILITSRLYPFVDLPNHLATATIYRHIGESGNEFAKYFAVHPVFPNANVVHLMVVGSQIFPSVEWANRLFYILCLVLVPGSTWLLIREVGGDSWRALLAFPLVFHLNTVFGFVGFTIAVPVLMLAVFATMRSLRGSLWWSVLTGALLMLLFCAHALAFLFGLLVCCAIFAQSAANRGRIVAAAPSAWMFATWWMRRPVEESTLTYMADYYWHHYFWNLPVRALFPLMDFYQLLPGALGPLLAAGLAGVILVPLVRNWRDGIAAGRHRPLAILLFAALVCCIVLPPEIPREPVLYQRFSVFLFLAAIVLISRRPLPLRWRAGVFGIALACTALRAHYFREFNRENEGFDAAFLRRAEGRTMGIVYEPGFRGWPLYIHFPNYKIVWNHGIAGTAAIDYRFGVVRRKAGTDALPVYREWIREHGTYSGEYASVENLLVRGDPPREWLDRPSGVRYSEFGRAGMWHLYRNGAAGRGMINEGSGKRDGRVAQLAEQLTLNQ